MGTVEVSSSSEDLAIEMANDEDYGSDNDFGCNDNSDDDFDDCVLTGSESSNQNHSACSSDDSYDYDVIPMSDIVVIMQDEIEEANKILNLPKTTVRLLLQHFSWNRDKLLESFYNGDESTQQELYRKVGIINPDASGSGQDSDLNLETEATTECGVCLMEIPRSTLFGIACGHRFCSPCWDAYLTHLIQDEIIGQPISCIAHKCNILVDDQTVMDVVSNSAVKLKYQQLITNSFVACSAMIQWCPFPNCSHAIKVHNTGPMLTRAVLCKCDHEFCFNCTAGAHDPVSCEMMDKWKGKVKPEEHFSTEWIMTHTKPCPNCRANIEKNGGCNHMVCRKCRHEFCWFCLKTWSSHVSRGVYNCAVIPVNDPFVDVNVNIARTAIISWKRYLRFNDRYSSHLASLSQETRLYDAVVAKMVELSDDLSQHSLVDLNWMKESARTLLRCRQLLTYSYVFAYFVKRTDNNHNNQIQIFEGNQENLAGATEKLSGLLEHEVNELYDNEELLSVRPQVVDCYKFCESRRKSLFDHIREGHEKDWWEFEYEQ